MKELQVKVTYEEGKNFFIMKAMKGADLSVMDLKNSEGLNS